MSDDDVHQLPNPFPPLDAAADAALRTSIRMFGVLVPVARDPHGRTLDGHNRERIAGELGAEYRVDVLEVRDDEHARTYQPEGDAVDLRAGHGLFRGPARALANARRRRLRGGGFGA
jgi:hypothetical protein